MESKHSRRNNAYSHHSDTSGEKPSLDTYFCLVMGNFLETAKVATQSSDTTPSMILVTREEHMALCCQYQGSIVKERERVGREGGYKFQVQTIDWENQLQTCSPALSISPHRRNSDLMGEGSHEGKQGEVGEGVGPSASRFLSSTCRVVMISPDKHQMLHRSRHHGTNSNQITITGDS